MINFLKDDVAFGSIIIIAVRDSTNKNRFTENSVAYLEKLGAGIEGCPVKISKLFLSFVKHMLTKFYKKKLRKFFLCFSFFLYKPFRKFSTLTKSIEYVKKAFACLFVQKNNLYNVHV